VTGVIHAVRAVSTVPRTVTAITFVFGVVHLAAPRRVVASVHVWRSGAAVIRMRAVVGTVTSVIRVAVLIVLIMHRVFLFHRIIPPGLFHQPIECSTSLIKRPKPDSMSLLYCTYRSAAREIWPIGIPAVWRVAG
jgi:hypothetical protein